MPATLRALRGATTADADTEPHVHTRVVELLTEMCSRNDVDHDDIVSILFTATDDLHATFPAAGARKMGLGDVPLICARELDVVGGTERCIRVLMHLTTERARNELHHVYLEGAVGLRDDLPG
ncbi:MAG: chorismate mutase [Acidimicrobiales bacterium]|nr:chorismate mutase [Acidimicrobiales bacterium]